MLLFEEHRQNFSSVKFHIKTMENPDADFKSRNCIPIPICFNEINKKLILNINVGIS